MESFDILGTPVSVVNLQTAASTILSWNRDQLGRFVCVRDVHGIMLARKNKLLFRSHKLASLVVPDGKPLVLEGKRLGFNIDQTTGFDLMARVISEGVEKGTKHYFYGGALGVAEELKDVFEKRFPGVMIVGTHSPPFRRSTDEEAFQIQNEVRNLEVDIVWVGLSTPKQEQWMMENYGEIPSTLIGVGAAFDFHTGRVKRAPKIVQSLMLEWFYRFLQEPRRLWYRYLVLVPSFIYHHSLDVISSLLKRKRLN